MLYNVTDAVFTPLAKRQDARGQQANVQTATNDTLTAVAVAYFDAQEARADLASIDEVARMVADLVRRTEKLVPDFAPEVELARVRAIQKNIEQGRSVARMQWRIVSAELGRVLRLNSTVVVQPLEPPHLRVTLIPPATPPDEMIPVALRFRPELSQYQAQIAAAEERLRQERFRPFLPTVVMRGGATPTPYPLGMGGFAGGSGDNLSNMTGRVDWDLEAIWELKNLGFGNAALIRERRAGIDLAREQSYRFQDFVAKEVRQAWAQYAPPTNAPPPRKENCSRRGSRQPKTWKDSASANVPAATSSSWSFAPRKPRPRCRRSSRLITITTDHAPTSTALNFGSIERSAIPPSLYSITTRCRATLRADERSAVY